MTEPASAPANRPMASLVAPPVAISPARNSGTAANAMVSPVATANLLRITVDRGTGVASRCTTLPSSISAPSTLVPTISAVSGSTTASPKPPRITLGQSAWAGPAAFSSAVTSTRISGGSANSSARLRPSVARRVIEATVLACTERAGTGSISDLHQVGEHALQRLILGQQLTELDAVLPREPRDLPAERAVVRGLHLQPAAAHLHPAHGRPADQRRAQPPVVGGAHQELVRPAGHQPPDGAEIPGRGQPPGHDDLDGAGQPLHFLQDVRAEQDRPALVAEG